MLHSRGLRCKDTATQGVVHHEQLSVTVYWSNDLLEQSPCGFLLAGGQLIIPSDTRGYERHGRRLTRLSTPVQLLSWRRRRQRPRLRLGAGLSTVIRAEPCAALQHCSAHAVLGRLVLLRVQGAAHDLLLLQLC